MEDTSGRSDPTGRRLTLRDVAIVTVSYRGDLELARDLCRSVDVHLPAEVEHILVVPRSDVPLFESLRDHRRRIVSKEEVLPSGYHRLPAPRRVRIGPFERHIRELWVGHGRPVRGWILQQIVKMSTPAFTDREVLVFADSDNVFVAPMAIDRLARDGLVRLYRVPGATADLATHVRWHDVSAGLLGLEPRGYLGSDYIGHLTTWRRSTLVLLQERLTEVNGRPWDMVVARESSFSEYILYGIFSDLVLSDAESGHYRTSEDLVHASWSYDLASDQGVAAFLSGLAPDQVAVAIQSTERFTVEQRREMVRHIVARGSRPHPGES